MHFLPTILPAHQLRINRAVWYFLSILMAVTTTLVYSQGLHIRWGLNTGFTIILGCSTLATIVCRYIWRNDTLSLCGHMFSQVAMFGLAATMLSYLGARLNYPYVTDALIALDASLGFEWRRFIFWYYDLAIQRPMAPVLDFIYLSLELQAISLLVLLCLAKQTAHAQRFVIAICITSLVVIAVSTVFPAEMAYVFYDKRLPDFRQLHPMAAQIDSDTMGMRTHTSSNIPFPGVGIATFPSFHAVLAILFMYASLPLRYLRPLVILFNLAMLFATLICGGHYLIDIIAGIVVALGSILLAKCVHPATPTVASVLLSGSAKRNTLVRLRHTRP